MSTAETTASRRAGVSTRSRLMHRAGTALIVIGLLALLWGFVVWRWNDPFTSLYTRWQQHKLQGVYTKVERDYRPIVIPAPRVDTAAVKLAAERKALATAAAAYRRSSKNGAPIGRIVVPRLGLNMLLINGTDHDSLIKGPGRDERSFMPGQGQLVYVAGHRTTYLAPFSHIDSMKAGDRITLRLPYATVVYSVTGHVIVDAHDMAVLQSHGKEVLALQACHPRFFATHRYIVWAKPVQVTLRGGATFTPKV